MALSAQNIFHAYDPDQPVLKNVSLRVEKGDILTLLGASGCGKSTLLQLLGGLLPLQAGEIILNDQIMAKGDTDLPPEKRPIGLMFQDGALFPHMSVEKNIAFGLKDRAVSNAARIKELLALIGLDDYGPRMPGTLSGGEQQRVALARSLAPRPEAMLLDEPFASIDVVRRRHLREQTRLILKASGTPTVFVTHDPAEALDMSDQIAVIVDGEIIQHASPADIYNRPENAKVAAMFGDAQTFGGNVQGSEFNCDAGKFDVSSILAQSPTFKGAAQLVLRPYGVRFIADAAGDILVRDHRFNGRDRHLVLGREGEMTTDFIKVFVTDEPMPILGTTGHLQLQPKGAFLFPRK